MHWAFIYATQEVENSVEIFVEIANGIVFLFIIFP